MRTLSHILASFLVLIFLSCQPETVETGNPPTMPAKRADYLPIAPSESSVAEALEQVRNSDPIVAAWSHTTRPGFFQELFDEAMNFLGLKYLVRPSSFSEYFVINGEVPAQVYTDPDFTYRPSLLDEVSVYVTDFSILAWREKLVDFVPLLPTRMVFIAREGEAFSQVSNLDGKRVLTSPGTSYERILTELIQEHGIQPVLVEVPPNATFARFLLDGEVDAAPNDSLYAIRSLRNLPGLVITLPIAEYDMLAWAVDPEKPELKLVLDYAVGELQSQGLFNELLLEHFGITLDDYLSVISWGSGVFQPRP